MPLQKVTEMNIVCTDFLYLLCSNYEVTMNLRKLIGREEFDYPGLMSALGGLEGKDLTRVHLSPSNPFR